MLTRTSDEDAPRRWSAPLPDLNLHDPRRWQPKDYAVPARDFGSSYVEYLGTLPEIQLVVVLDLWEQGT